MPPVKKEKTNGARGNPGDRTPNQDEIARRAYAIWQDAGSPDGAHSEHWLQAERDLASSLGASRSSGRVPAPAPAPESTTPYSASGSSSVSGQGATSSGSGGRSS